MSQFLKFLQRLTLGLFFLYFCRVLLILIPNFIDSSVVINQKIYKLNFGCNLINEKNGNGLYMVINVADLWNPFREKEYIKFYYNIPVLMRDEYLHQPGSYFPSNLGKAYIGRSVDPWRMANKNNKLIAIDNYFIVAKNINAIDYCINQLN